MVYMLLNCKICVYQVCISTCFFKWRESVPVEDMQSHKSPISFSVVPYLVETTYYICYYICFHCCLDTSKNNLVPMRPPPTVTLINSLQIFIAPNLPVFDVSDTPVGEMLH